MTDYTKLIAQARRFATSETLAELVSALESLVAENEKLRDASDENDGRWTEIVERTEAGWRKTNRELIATVTERDALREQIDALKDAWHDDTNWADFGLAAQRILFAPVRVEVSE